MSRPQWFLCAAALGLGRAAAMGSAFRSSALLTAAALQLHPTTAFEKIAWIGDSVTRGDTRRAASVLGGRRRRASFLTAAADVAATRAQTREQRLNTRRLHEDSDTQQESKFDRGNPPLELDSLFGSGSGRRGRKSFRRLLDGRLEPLLDGRRGEAGPRRAPG